MAENGTSHPFSKTLTSFLENAFAYALPVFMLQFIVQPLIADTLGAEANGRFLALIALHYFIINLTSTVLVNTRLLKNKQYEALQVTGDFNIFLLFFTVLNSCVILGGTFFYSDWHPSPEDLVMSSLFVILATFHDYIIVQYRTELRFRNILINNVILCVGYLIGSACMQVFPHWQIVFLIPYSLTAIYDLRHTNYIREPLRKTALFTETLKQYLLLMGSSLLVALTTYGDRLILYPLMDGKTVSILSSAQLASKMLLLISTPVTTFLLAHLVQSNTKKIFLRWYYPLIALAAMGMLYLGCVILSAPLLGFLYPQWADISLAYVPLTAFNGVLHMSCLILNTVVLRFCKAKWQLVKSAVYLASYLVFSFALLHFLGLTGFCIGNIIASAVNLLFVCFILVKEKVFTANADPSADHDKPAQVDFEEGVL